VNTTTTAPVEMITSKDVPLPRCDEENDLPSYCAPIRVEELFAAVAALQHLCDEYDNLHWSPPPLWPMVLRAGWCAPVIHVVLRVRPHTTQDTAWAEKLGLRVLRSALMISGRKCTVLRQPSNDTPTSEEPVSQEDEVFEFDHCICLAPEGQVSMPVPCADEYETNRYYSRKAATAALHGRNVCIVAYGAVGSGKTSALFGHSSDGTPTCDGLAQHLARDLFASIGSDSRITVTCALIAEVKNCHLVDLLSKDADGRASYAEVLVRQAEATRVLVDDVEALMKFLEEGVTRCKACAAKSWSMLAERYREPSFVMQLHITRSGDTAAGASTTAVALVDLYRSSRVPQIQFGACMDCISNDHPRERHIPVRCTSLTFLLSDCFTQRESLRVVVATVSPHVARLAPTVETLREVRKWKHTSFV
jgi:hypothetical protein